MERNSINVHNTNKRRAGKGVRFDESHSNTKKLLTQVSCLNMFQLIMYFHESLVHKKINKNPVIISCWRQIVVTCNEMGLFNGAALTNGRCSFKYGMFKIVPQYWPTTSLLFYHTYFRFD